MTTILRRCGVAGLLVLAIGCGGKVPPALVTSSPSPADVQQVRAVAVRIAEATNTALVVVDQAAKLADASPMPMSVKDAIDCSIIKVTGLTAPATPAVIKTCGKVPDGPGVLVKALGVLSSVTSTPSLRATVVEILGELDPLLGQLEASGQPALVSFAAVLRVALAYSRQFLGGA